MPSHVKTVRRSVPNVISVKPAEDTYAAPVKSALFQTTTHGIAIGGNIATKSDGVSKMNTDQEMLEKVLNAKLPEEENVTFSEFAENSTFHGIKYIFNSGFIVRRVMWVLCVIGAIILFTVQVGSRTQDFFHYSTTVDVELTYTDKIKFPAVTLCNQNNFRTSAMVDNGLYYFIDEIYSTTGSSNVNVSDYEFTQTESVSFLTGVAHQFDDLVDQCVWNGHSCDRSDFKKTFTDVGACFTFNADKKSPRNVKKSGSAFGLKLILNVEQYEYMKGPNNDAGVKILLHDQSEFPLMQDKGFAVAPGTHTIVVVEKGEVQSLEPPYGTCDGTMGADTRSDCLRTCRTRQMKEECGCMDAYMDNSTVNTRVCDVTTIFDCVKNAKETGIISDSECDCGVPCFRHTYEPTMSYAQLSQFNIERMVLVDPRNRERAEQNFLLATEYSQRVVVDIAESDRTQLTEMMEYIIALDETIGNISIGFASVETFQDIFDTPIPMSNYEEVYDPEIVMLGTTRQNIYDYAYNWFPGSYRSESESGDIAEKLSWLLETSGNTMAGRLDGCAGQMTARAFDSSFDPLAYYSTYEGIWVDQDYVPFFEFPASYNFYAGNCHYYLDPDSYRGWWPMIYEALFSCYTHLDVCDVYIATKIRQAASIQSDVTIPTTNPRLATATDLRDNYMEMISAIFNNTYNDPSDIPEHIECLATINAYENDVDFPIAEAIVSLDSMSNATSLDDIRADLEALELIVSNHSLVEISDVVSTCSWYHAYISYTWLDGICYNDENNEDLDCDRYNDYQSGLDEMSRYGTATELLFSSMFSKIRGMRTTSHNSLVGTLYEAIQNYLDMNITKTQLATIVQSHVVKNAIEDVISDGSDFISSSIEAIQQALLTRTVLESAYTELYSFVLPVMSQEVVENMTYIRYLRESNNTDINAILSNLHADPLNATIEMIRQMYTDVLMAALDNARSELDTRLDYLSEAASSLEDSLETYTADTRMNYKFYTENFLQVDIFYKELSFERVEQQPSFPFLSLLSEVGGFLGLLLGASILTVCELLDWIVMTISSTCKKKKPDGEKNKQKDDDVQC